MALVFGVIRRSMSAGSAWYESSSTSQKTTLACAATSMETVAMKVHAGVMTSSPGSRSEP